MPGDIKRGMDAGFFRCLTKPIRVNEFMSALDVALESSERAAVSAEAPVTSAVAVTRRSRETLWNCKHRWTCRQPWHPIRCDEFAATVKAALA